MENAELKCLFVFCHHGAVHPFQIVILLTSISIFPNCFILSPFKIVTPVVLDTDRNLPPGLSMIAITLVVILPEIV